MRCAAAIDREGTGAGSEHPGLIRWMQVPALLAPEIEYRAQGAPALEGACETGRLSAGARNFGGRLAREC